MCRHQFFPCNIFLSHHAEELLHHIEKNNNDRAKTILGVAGLENRLADAKDNIEFKEINYQGVKERLDRYKERSMEWIQKCLDDEMADGGIE